MGGQRKSDDGRVVDVYELAINLSERIARVEQEVKDLRDEISVLRKDVKEELRLLRSEMKSIIDTERRRDGMMKYMIVVLTLVLSFVAALLGIGWRPP